MGYPKNYTIMDADDQKAVLKEAYKQFGMDTTSWPYGSMIDYISNNKAADISVEKAYELAGNYSADRNRAKVYEYYVNRQQSLTALDFDDLILWTVRMFRRFPHVLEKWQGRFRCVLVDEFQDIDALQYELIRQLAGTDSMLYVVGDPDQTIYTWRGASVRYLLDFDRDFPSARTILMMQNYRSTPQILAAANALIARNASRIKKELIPTLPDGQSVLCHYAENSEAEAKWILSEIRGLEKAGVPLSEIAVLYRAHYITRSLEELFLKEKLPYAIYSGVQFFDRMEIKDALSYLRMLCYRDDLSFLRTANTPKRNLGQRRMAFLRAWADEHGCSLYEALRRTSEDEIFRGTRAAKYISLIEHYTSLADTRPVSELLAAILAESGYEEMLRTEGSQERLDNLAELKQSIYEYETSCGEECSLEHYLKHVALFTNADTAEAPDKIKLMTVHSAKGLEFPYVFLCAMNEGVFPGRKTVTLPGMEEERRLAFVAVTRAEKRLFLSESAGRSFDGAPKYPSRFLLDIGEENLELTAPPRADLIADAREYIAHSERFLPERAAESAFPVGTRVRHAIMGEGTVEALDTEKSAYLIRFDCMETPRAISFKARLERGE